MVAYTKSSLKIAEFYYQPPASEDGLDIARCFYQQEPIKGTVQAVFHTLQIDLQQETEQLLAAMKKSNRQNIRYAERDAVTTQASSNPSEAWMQEFFVFYDVFAQGKQLVPANRRRLTAMREAGALDLSRAVNTEGNVVVWHCALRTTRAARLIHSCSMHREGAHNQATARANCLLHWNDLVRFREEGFATFDFGGWYAGILGRNRYSEFAGLSETEQEVKISCGLTIFQKEDVHADAWVAPAHSFDQTTLKVLARHGIRHISDGYAWRPFCDRDGRVWAPQQIGRFRKMPAGAWTICLHCNAWTSADIQDFAGNLQRYRGQFTTFDTAVREGSARRASWSDAAFFHSLRTLRRMKDLAWA